MSAKNNRQFYNCLNLTMETLHKVSNFYSVKFPILLKKTSLLLLLVFAYCPSANATHEVMGGEFYYRYIGDSTNIARQYLVGFIYYSGSTTNSIPSQIAIDVNSTCSTGGSYLANPISGSPPFGTPIYSNYSCNGNPGGYSYKKMVYETVVTLPVNCIDWEFQTTLVSRSNAVANLVNPGIYGFYIKATLNSFYPNNSPRIINQAPREFCMGADGSIVFNQSAIESDGDSLVYYFGIPEDGPHPGTPVPFVSGYSVNAPFQTSNGMNLNSSTGLMNFKLLQSGMENFKINIDEFRFDSLSNTWLKVGTISKEIQIQINLSCSPSVSNWNLQSNTLNTQVTANCGDSIINLQTSTPFACSSLSSDGSDFVIYKSDGTLLPIIGASTNCSNFYSNSVKIQLYAPISQNDSLYIVTTIGSDFNTLTNYCGFELPEGDSLSLKVIDCSGVGLVESDLVTNIFPNPVENFTEIEFKDASQKTISLLSADGKLIRKSEVFSNKIRLDVAFLPPGFYLIKVMAKGKVETNRIFKN